MPKQFEYLSNKDLKNLVLECIEWDTTGVIPDGQLRAQADLYMENVPVDVVVARKHCREAAIQEAAKRWVVDQKDE